MIVSLGVLADPYPQIEGVMFGVKFWCEILQTSWIKAELRKETEEKVAEAEALNVLYIQPGKFNTMGENLSRPRYGCFQKKWYPQIIHFNRVFHYKPSILGYP